jgi:hypothetical protein
MGQVNDSTRKSVQEWQPTFLSTDLSPEVSFFSSSGSGHHEEEQMKYQGYEKQTHMNKFSLLIAGFINPILPFIMANLRNLVQYYIEFVTIKVSLFCHVPFAKQPFRHQITVSNNTIVD